MEELGIEGCRAIEIGTFSSTKQRGAQPVTTGTGKYLLVWRKTGNSWLIEYDRWH